MRHTSRGRITLGLPLPAFRRFLPDLSPPRMAGFFAPAARIRLCAS
jgi:hypothetical protein